MAFSLFGKRDKPDQQPDQPTEVEPQEQKRGFFDRMKQAVTRTRESLSDSISSVIALTREVDETTLIGLEPVLLAADLGAPTTALVLENLRQRALRTGIQGGDELKQLLKSELKQILDGVARPIRHATPQQLRARSFPAGSMGPKVEAACRFVEATGRMAAIGRLDAAQALLDRTAGTIVSR